MSGETLIILALLIPAAGAGLIALTSWHSNLRETVTLVTAATLFGVVMMILGRVMDGEQLMTGSFQIMIPTGRRAPGRPLNRGTRMQEPRLA